MANVVYVLVSSVGTADCSVERAYSSKERAEQVAELLNQGYRLYDGYSVREVSLDADLRLYWSARVVMTRDGEVWNEELLCHEYRPDLRPMFTGNISYGVKENGRYLIECRWHTSYAMEARELTEKVRLELLDQGFWPMHKDDDNIHASQKALEKIVRKISPRKEYAVKV